MSNYIKLLLTLFLVNVIYSDVIEIDGNKKFYGKIKKLKDSYCLLKTDYGEIKIKRSNIRAISFNTVYSDPTKKKTIKPESKKNLNEKTSPKHIISETVSISETNEKKGNKGIIVKTMDEDIGIKFNKKNVWVVYKEKNLFEIEDSIIQLTDKNKNIFAFIRKEKTIDVVEDFIDKYNENQKLSLNKFKIVNKDEFFKFNRFFYWEIIAAVYNNVKYKYLVGFFKNNETVYVFTAWSYETLFNQYRKRIFNLFENIEIIEQY